MADSDKTREIFFDGPTRVLVWIVGGLAALVLGLSLRAYLQLSSVQAKPPMVRASPTPTPQNALRLFAAPSIQPRDWRIEQDAPDNLRIVAPSGAIFEQKLLPLSLGLSPRVIIERIDERLAHWGQEYQQIRLGSVERGGLKMTRLEHTLNLRGKPTQRTVTIAGRVRVNGERRVALWTLVATEESFERDKDALRDVGIVF